MGNVVIPALAVGPVGPGLRLHASAFGVWTEYWGVFHFFLKVGLKLGLKSKNPKQLYPGLYLFSFFNKR